MITHVFFAIFALHVIKKAQAKGRSATGYFLLLLLFWYLGSLLSGVVALRVMDLPLLDTLDPMLGILAMLGLFIAGPLVGALFVIALLEGDSAAKPAVRSSTWS